MAKVTTLHTLGGGERLAEADEGGALLFAR